MKRVPTKSSLIAAIATLSLPVQDNSIQAVYEKSETQVETKSYEMSDRLIPKRIRYIISYHPTALA